MAYNDGYKGHKDSIKAWINFNGTSTIAIRSSYNISSITDNGNGDYTVTFSTAMEDANYSVSTSMAGTSGAYANVDAGFGSGANAALAAGSMRLRSKYAFDGDAYSYYDYSTLHAQVFGR